MKGGQVHSIVHSLDHMRRSQAYWQVDRVVDPIRQLLKLARVPLLYDNVIDPKATLISQAPFAFCTVGL